MSRITTHILDTSAGRPAEGIKVVLESDTEGKREVIGSGISDKDGRIKDLVKEGSELSPGIYRLIFDIKTYHSSMKVKGFYPSVTIEFEITDGAHYHVPLLLNPYGYSTYRGS